jgi:hypothetical protein
VEATTRVVVVVGDNVEEDNVLLLDLLLLEDVFIFIGIGTVVTG